ncbi:hypothetical protein [Ekhidna sp.]|uniref:hypothetical protein n=1 Tax=Ekhidna sp. TaxID=2608089 RepID=UPI003B5B0710
MKLISMYLLNLFISVLEDPEPLEYASEWKGWYLIPILVVFLLVGYWVRKRRKRK